MKNEKVRIVYNTAKGHIEECRTLEEEDHYFLYSFATNYVLFEEATDALLESSILLPGHNGSMRRNPLIMARNTFYEAWMKSAQSLGLGVTQRERWKFESNRPKPYDPTDPMRLE